MGDVKRLCRAQASIHYGGFEHDIVECERRHDHRGKHRISWHAGNGKHRWKIRVTWTSG